MRRKQTRVNDFPGLLHTKAQLTAENEPFVRKTNVILMTHVNPTILSLALHPCACGARSVMAACWPLVPNFQTDLATHLQRRAARARGSSGAR